jgi:hypothetical protein
MLLSPSRTAIDTRSTITNTSPRLLDENAGAEHYPAVQRSARPQRAETKASFKTTELIAYVAPVLAVIITALAVGTTATAVAIHSARWTRFATSAT